VTIWQGGLVSSQLRGLFGRAGLHPGAPERHICDHGAGNSVPRHHDAVMVLPTFSDSSAPPSAMAWAGKANCSFSGRLSCRKALRRSNLREMIFRFGLRLRISRSRLQRWAVHFPAYDRRRRPRSTAAVLSSSASIGLECSCKASESAVAALKREACATFSDRRDQSRPSTSRIGALPGQVGPRLRRSAAASFAVAIRPCGFGRASCRDDGAGRKMPENGCARRAPSHIDEAAGLLERAVDRSETKPRCTLAEPPWSRKNGFSKILSTMFSAPGKFRTVWAGVYRK